jgi:uncharacterized protein
MRQLVRLLLSCATLASLAGTSAAQAPTGELARPAGDSFVVPTPAGLVNDFAHVLTPADTSALLRMIQEVRVKCRAEIAVVTLASLQGASAADAARRIGATWGVGPAVPPTDPAFQSGVVILVAPLERQFRLELADAARFITNEDAGRLLDEQMLPALKQQEYGRAIRQTLQAVAQRFAKHFNFELMADARH